MAKRFIRHSEGRFNGGSYKIHRDRLSTHLSVTLADNASFYANPDAIIAKHGQIVYKRSFRFTLQKLVTDDPFFEFVLVGPGEVLLAPPIWGQIIPIHVDEETEWIVGRTGPLAMTNGVTKETRSQPVFRNIFMREATFVYRILGSGVVFVTSSGSFQQRDLDKGEEWVANHSSLIAWNCSYWMESVGPCIHCHFRGPGTVLMQTHNPTTLFNWVMYNAPAKNDNNTIYALSMIDQNRSHS